jgi:hypothetical protein
MRRLTKPMGLQLGPKRKRGIMKVIWKATAHKGWGVSTMPDLEFVSCSEGRRSKDGGSKEQGGREGGSKDGGSKNGGSKDRGARAEEQGRGARRRRGIKE